MPFVFISHASEDKRDRVKPLVEALALQLAPQQIELWIDRPGHGSSHFGFNDDFIARYRVHDLRSGSEWAGQIETALQTSGAILLCLSKSALSKILADPQGVLTQEVSLGLSKKKLVACIVDDLPVGEIPRNAGAVDFANIQMEQVEPNALGRAVAHLRAADTAGAENTLPDDAKKQWEIVRKLARDIKAAIGIKDITPDWSLEDVFAPFLKERRTFFFGRDWLFDSVTAWPEACPTERMMLITGAPGTGKSAVAGHLIDKQRCGTVIAYHCFRHDESRTLRLDGFVRNLAFMLAKRLPDYRAMLAHPAPQQAFAELERSPEDGAARFFKHAIFGPLAGLEKPPELAGGTAWIVIDGLDEVAGTDDKLTKARLIDLFADGLHHLPSWLRVVATSRDEDVADQLGRIVDDGRPLVHRIPLDEASDDIKIYRAYVDERLSASGKQLPELSKTALLERSQLNFLYLKLVLDGFLAGTYRVEDIARMPPGLPRIYDLNFRRYYPDPENRDFRGVAQALLEALAVARNPLAAESLSAITHVDEPELHRQLRKLAAYLPANGGKYTIFHKSFKDWLLEPDGPYTVSDKSGHARLAEYCWTCFVKNRSRVTSISDLDHEDAWLYAMHHGIDHMLAAGLIAWPVDLVHFLLDKWDEERDGTSALKDLTPRQFTRVVLRAFDDCTDEEKRKIDPLKLAPLLTDFYQIEPLEGPLAFLVEQHGEKWNAMQDDFLRAENYVLRYAISHVLAGLCTEPGATVSTDRIYGYFKEPDINFRELGAYTLRHLYSRTPKLIKTEYLELMGDSETYPGRSALGDLLLNLTFQKRFDARKVKSQLFWEPIWDHNRLDVWDLKAAVPFLAEQRLPLDADAGTKRAHAALVQTEAVRQELLAMSAVNADRTLHKIVKDFFQLGSKLDLISDADEAIAASGRVQEIMRFLFGHPLWDVAEMAASVLTSYIEADRTMRDIVRGLFDEPNWRVRFGAIETAFQLAQIDRMVLFGEAVKRFYADDNSRVRALCAENLISHILDRPPSVRDSYLAEFRAPIARWLHDDDCWVLEHVFRLLRKLGSDGFDCGAFFDSGMPVLLEGLPKSDWHELPRETFLTHIEARRRAQITGPSPSSPC